MGKRKQITPGQAAWRGMKAHPMKILIMTAEQVLIRLLVLFPLLLPSFIAVPDSARWALAALAAVLLLIPLRFHAGEILRYISGPRERRPAGGRPYRRWLATGLVRWVLSLLWGLPFLFCAGYFIYGWPRVRFTELWKPVLALTLPGSAALLIFFLLLMIYGWWRYLPAEYMPVRHLGVKKTLFFVRRARRIGRKELIRNALTNMLLTLPAVIGCLAVLIPYVRENLRASSQIQLLISSALRLLRMPLPRKQAMELLAVYLILYLPLCVLRKARNAVAIRRLTRELKGLGEDHAAG